MAKDEGSRVLRNPTALFGGCEISRNARFSETLINNKWPLGVDPGGHHFLLLNVSINKTAVFVSEVVTYNKRVF